MYGIERYTPKDIGELWTRKNQYQSWLLIEAIVAKVQAQNGLIPKDAASAIQKAAEKLSQSIDEDDFQKIDDIEAETRHDVIAFLEWFGGHLDHDAAAYLHYGLTSSDMLDTALNTRLQKASQIIIQDSEKLLAILKSKAIEYKYLYCMGRTHGMAAQITTFGLKFLRFYAAFERHLKRFQQAVKGIQVGGISGAVGSYTTLPPVIEEQVCQQLGLAADLISTQVIPRDRHLAWVQALAAMACDIENIAVEIRHLQRSEVNEAAEAFGKKQKGSSAMPHKKNPVLSENLCGLAREIRSCVLPAMENVTLWHERDISHSSSERMMFPKVSILTVFSLRRLASVIEHLYVNEKQIQHHIDQNQGLVFSQKILTQLLDCGMCYADAYPLVQQLCFITKQHDCHLSDMIKKMDSDVLVESVPALMANKDKHKKAISSLNKLKNMNLSSIFDIHQLVTKDTIDHVFDRF